MNKITIRSMKETDPATISQAFKLQGWNKTTKQYEKYFAEQQNSKRDVFIAEYEEEFAAYVTIQWNTDYKPFIEKDIPEIKDLNTLIKFRNKGIATALMNKAEAKIKEKGYKTIGLGVGLYSDYGTAQRMYVKRGYNFDGRGIAYHGEIIKPGSNVCVDDSLTLSMTKEI